MTPRYVAVPGTWAWRERDDPLAWFNDPESAFARKMAALGVVPLRPRDPFLWTTRVNGHQFWRRWLAPFIPDRWERGDHVDWDVSGRQLRFYREVDAADDGSVAYVAHSHGGQVAAYAAARGLRMRVLFTVATPVRADMAAVYEAARSRVDLWVHLYDPTGADRTQIEGELGDGRVSIMRTMPAAPNVINVAVRGMAHSRALVDPAMLRVWDEQADRLRGRF